MKMQNKNTKITLRGAVAVQMMKNEHNDMSKAQKQSFKWKSFRGVRFIEFIIFANARSSALA